MKKRGLLILFIFLFVNLSLLKSQLNVNFVADTTFICENTPLSFTDLTTSDTTILSWNWDFGNGEYSTSQNPIVIFDSAGIFTIALSVTDANGTSLRTKYNYIKVRKKPDAIFTAQTFKDIFHTSDSVAMSSFWYEFASQSVLPDSLEYKFSWDFGTGTFVDSLDTVIYQFNAAGDYWIYLTVDAGLNCSDTDTVMVTVEDQFRAPNVFTPNNDGINDLFVIETNGVHVYKMTIFNRWGNIVFQSNSKKLIWDGYSPSGVEVKQGIYYYHISSDESGFSQNGYVHLFR